jgi:transglutaminase-like putative cysteine protease
VSAELRRIAAFSALAAFASFHWFMLVSGADDWRWVACAGVGAGGALILVALRSRRRVVVFAGSFVVFVAMLAEGLIAVGIPVELVLPGGWDELQAELSNGLSGISQIETPYAGDDPWARLGILAAVPLAIALATLATFWPAGRSRAAMPIGLAVLLLLYGTSVTWEAPSAELLRGALLFGFVAAVLWLPQIRLPRLAAALAAVLVAGAVALPLASRVNASDPLISYTSWQVFGADERISFNWNHTYGPLDWPQEGTEVFTATTGIPTYFKTFVLDEFDGDSWTRASDAFGEDGDGYDLAGASDDLIQAHPEWIRTFDVQLSGLRSRLIPSSGSSPQIDGIEVGDVSGDGTASADDFEVASGSDYSVAAYVPDPSPRQLRRADGDHPVGTERYTTMLLRGALSPAEERIGRPAPVNYAEVPPDGVDREPRSFTGTERIGKIVKGTPYERVLELARRLTAGARTDYSAVSRIQRFLDSNYTYDQDVAPRQDPLPAFLLRDRRGYCQQFAGSMALMLRMVGIPSRVVSGFAPGVREEGGVYSVSDTDAHAWVEVLYPGIGWVTVDPTPAQAPAHTNVTLPGAGQGASQTDPGVGRAFTEREGERDRPGGLKKQREGEAEEDGTSPLALLAILGLGGGAGGIVVRRRRRLRSPEGAALQLGELRDALALTGSPAVPGTTLAAIGERLRSIAGPEAARYASGLLESKYGRRTRRRPGPDERRAFRWALARNAGVFGWWRALRAIPPGGPRAKRGQTPRTGSDPTHRV